MEETGPMYGVKLIESLPIDGGMSQAMPSRRDLEQAAKINQRVSAGYEVAIAHLVRLTAERDEMIRDMADAVRSACDGDIGEVEKTLVPWCHNIIVAREEAARDQLNRDLANAARENKTGGE